VSVVSSQWAAGEEGYLRVKLRIGKKFESFTVRRSLFTVRVSPTTEN
jgi:hypothetical protein